MRCPHCKTTFKKNARRVKNGGFTCPGRTTVTVQPPRPGADRAAWAPLAGFRQRVPCGRTVTA